MLYIYDEGGVGKSRIVYATELGCVLLLCNSDLVITILMGVVADNIGGRTIHTSLAIGIRNRHGKLNTISNLWIT